MKRLIPLALGLLLFAALPVVSAWAQGTPPGEAAPSAGPAAEIPLSFEETQAVLQAVFLQSEKSYERNLEQMRDYCFFEEQQSYERKKDELILGTTRLLFNFFSEEYEGFRSTLMEIDGKKVSEKRRRKHDKAEEKRLKRRKKAREEEAREEQEEAAREAARAETGGDDEGEKKKKKKRRQIDIAEPDILKHLVFSRAGEREYEGVRAEIYHFEPNPDIPVKETKKDPIGRILKNVEGEFWVTPGDRQLLKLSYRFTDKVKPMKFVKVKVFSYELEMTHVDGKYWFPRRMEFHVEGRVAIIPFREHMDIRQYNFKRFRTGTDEAGAQGIEGGGDNIKQ